MSTVTAPLSRRPFRPDVHTREAGMATSEYALVTVAACAFAAVLYAVVTSSTVRDLLTRLVVDALGIGG